MDLLKRFAQGEFGLGTIEAFSDGVFAIVVTLLVLELKVPILHERNSASELGHQLVDLLRKFLSFPTALMGEYTMNAPAVSLFGVVMTVKNSR